MALGDKITTQIERLVAKIYLSHKDWKAAEIQQEVARQVAEHPKLYGDHYADWPGLSAVQRILAKIRKNDTEPKPMIDPWSIGTLNRYPLPAEAIPYILRVKMWAKKNLNYTLTIYQARWVSRLYAIPMLNTEEKLFKAIALYQCAEVSNMLIGQEVDTQQEDEDVFSGQWQERIKLHIITEETDIPVHYHSIENYGEKDGEQA